MKKAITFFVTFTIAPLIFLGCNVNSIESKIENSNEIILVNKSDQTKSTIKDPNLSIESVMNTLFEAARSGEVGILKLLLPPYGLGSCDGDCKALCNPGNESMKIELKNNYISLANFREYFSKGKIVGAPIITGNEGEVKFLFGPNLDKSETMHLQKINGKWYLKSF